MSQLPGETTIFLSTPSARRATFYRPGRYLPGMISIHALREEGDSVLSLNFDFFDISIHALREEGDSRLFCLACWNVYFYPRPPRGGRPGSLSMICFLRSFLSTPSARRATPERRIQRLQQPISIHALREEGDPHRHHLSKLAQKFLSTPSARRATCCRPPARGLSPISIHALREEGDPAACR